MPWFIPVALGITAAASLAQAGIAIASALKDPPAPPPKSTLAPMQPTINASAQQLRERQARRQGRASTLLFQSQAVLTGTLEAPSVSDGETLG